MLLKLPAYIPKINTKENKFYLLFFVIAVFGGALRKWFITSNATGNIVLLVQMAIPFLMVFYRSPKAVSPFQIFGFLYLYFFYLAVQVFNPLQLTIFHGIIGIVIYGGFWIGLFFYFANRHLFNPAQYAKFMLFVVILEFTLGFIQYQLPAEHFINRYANMDVVKQIATVGDRVRITGTFSYLGGFGSFIFFYLLFIWAIVKLQYPAWLVVSVALFGIVVSFMSGSRGVTALYFLFIGSILIKEYNLRTIMSLIGKTIIPVLIILTVLLLVNKFPLWDLVMESYNGFWGRVEQGRETGEESSRLVWDLVYFQEFKFKNALFGIGTAASYQGATGLFGTSPFVLEFGYVEGEIVKVMMEGGIILVIMKLVLSFIMVKQLAMKGFVRWVIWFAVAYFCPIVFQVHNAAFIFMGIVLIDNIFWREERAKWMALYGKKDEKIEEVEAAEIASLPLIPDSIRNTPAPN